MAQISNSPDVVSRTAADDAATEVFSEQVRLLYRLSRPVYAGTLAVALICLLGLWNAVPPAPLGIWFAAAVAITGARYYFYRQFVAHEITRATGYWSSGFVTGAVAMGVMWGLLGSLLLHAEFGYQLLIVFVVAGMVASGLMVLTPVKSAFVGFTLPALLPLIGAMVVAGDPVHLYSAAILAAFLAVMLAACPIVHKSHVTSLRIRFENADLVRRLSSANLGADVANRQLHDQLEAQKQIEAELQGSTDRVEALVAASPLAIVVQDKDGVITRWNAAAQRIFGWAEQEAIGMKMLAVPDDKRAEGVDFLERILRGEHFADVEAVRRRKDGVYISVSLSAAPLHDASGVANGILLFAADITERKRAERRQNIQNAVTVLLAEANTVDEAIPRIIQTLCEGLGWVAGARRIVAKDDGKLRRTEDWCVPSRKIQAFIRQSSMRVDIVSENAGLLRRVWAGGEPVWLPDLALEPTLVRGPSALAAGLHSAFAFPILVSGEFYGVIELFGSEVRQRDEDVVKIAVEIGSQIGQFIARKEAEFHLTFFANHDTLTGLPNRAMFNQRLTQALARAQRLAKLAAVLFIDLDRFKIINDTLGHDAGDRLLMQLAERLRECLREGDTIGRQGGDEFVVLIEDVADPQQVAGVGQKILETVARPYYINGQEFHVTASIGISIYPGDGSDQQTLLKNADIAMYRAKEQGKNNHQFYSAQMNLHSFERLALETKLRRAVERNEFLLHYQPKVDMKTDRITGVEALVRWQHPELGMVSPAEFIPLAEETGLIAPIGEWVLRTACAEAQGWIAQGMPPVSVAVNLSARQFARDDLAASIMQVLGETGLDPRLLELEITESTVMHNADRAAGVLQKLKELGVRVAIDDFGTGYSSLSYLKRFPISSVKIDRSFVLDLPDDKDDAAITQAVIAMAHSLRLRVVAEGVETAAQYRFLQEHQCDEMQGYFFSKPVDAPSLVRLFAAHLAEVKQV
jgi:diguanylate cyclase (GGDEF)-like protein/PAS domain S-box-containing protein